ncbi:sigma-70 family RNA polymerase sigma factor [Brucella pecoris]|uniref:RNA polymerase sigma-70 factor (ECF subfamily) n=1 Tax=Brucella pecoris TaxID=867683 RepID=A0A5C5CW69_9HYPH|nr:sigma-70 family RNA polymerase sigma factor [Brucella pecoris]MBB4091886.1 RNA polymerase sigma-70 factor (ECF subfamily) [Brucella pecoris]TNV15652.1 sigma-70 family RNA polymerase sigma factor [Brucella pecoris]
MSRFLEEMEECVPALRRYARALTHDADRADDLVQDCLERAIRKRSLWQPSGPLRAWLFRMLINLWRNELRHRRRAPDNAPLSSVTMEPQVASASPSRLAFAETARAIQLLSAEQREALLLIAIEGMSYTEAATVLDIPLGTLMSRLGRARATLRKLTEETGAQLRAVK